MSQNPIGFSAHFIPYADPFGGDYNALSQTAAHQPPRYFTPQQFHRMIQDCPAIHESDQERVRSLLVFLTDAVEQLSTRK